MNTYYFYRSYRLGGRILGTLGCSLAWAFFGSGVTNHKCLKRVEFA